MATILPLITAQLSSVTLKVCINLGEVNSSDTTPVILVCQQNGVFHGEFLHRSSHQHRIQACSIEMIDTVD
jgi:hypothetical protein